MDADRAEARPDAPTARRIGRAGGGMLVRARAPGRVNLIGDHTDYTGGWVLPMAIGFATVIELRRHGDRIELVSGAEASAVDLARDLSAEEVRGGADGDRKVPASATGSGWGRYVAGVAATLHPPYGGSGVVHSDVPVGAGLSSSSALTVALVLAAGFEGSALDLARTAQEAETLGSGVPGGIMDQLCSAAGRAGHALLIDCSTLDVRAIPVPPGAEVIVVHSGQTRTLVGSAYAERRKDCERAAELIGPLRAARPEAAEGIPDARLRRRARHVVSENARVLAAAEALTAGDLATVGRLMNESHTSLASDFEVSTPALDDLAAALRSHRGVLGARLTGAGFGGCVVALAEAGTHAHLSAAGWPAPAWLVEAADGASLEVIPD